jgi:hypothetical protein
MGMKSRDHDDLVRVADNRLLIAESLETQIMPDSSQERKD